MRNPKIEYNLHKQRLLSASSAINNGAKINPEIFQISQELQSRTAMRSCTAVLSSIAVGSASCLLIPNVVVGLAVGATASAAICITTKYLNDKDVIATGSSL
jgi:hypothetical protein